MADYTKIFRSIWRDKDFTSLPESPQRLYLLIITQPTISSCGVSSLSVRRWATLAPDTDADSVRTALTVLEARDYVWVDEDTEEIAARTYMQHDELWKQTQGRRSIELAIASVLSDPLRCRLEALASRVVPRVESTVEQSVDPLQQQAALACNNSSSKQPPVPPEDAHGLIEGDAAAAAYQLLIKHKIRTEDVRNTARYTKRLTADLPIEHGAAVNLFLAEHPESSAVEIAMHVLKLTTLDLVNIGAAA